MNKATRVLLHGIAWGGTAVFLNADHVGELVKAAAPGVTAFKALPVDGIHPNFAVMWAETMSYSCSPLPVPQRLYDPRCGSWLAGTGDPTVGQPALFDLVGAQAFLPKGCSGAKCLFVELQQAYLAAYPDSFATKAGNGGFFHSCYLGAYFGSRYNNTVLKKDGAIYNQIEEAKTRRDCLWNPNGTPPSPPPAYPVATASPIEDEEWEGNLTAPTAALRKQRAELEQRTVRAQRVCVCGWVGEVCRGLLERQRDELT
eukprot:gene16413-1282_t